MFAVHRASFIGLYVSKHRRGWKGHDILVALVTLEQRRRRRRGEEAQRGEVLDLLENETGMHSCLEPKPQASPVGAGGKRRHPRAHENTGIGADEPEA
jgi:hypothetical protein